MNTNENKVLGRASYTESERRELMAEFHSSGQTQAEFCREWNINPKTLARWLRLERENAAISFCEVSVPSESAPAHDLRIYLPNGIEVALTVVAVKDLGSILREAAGCLD